MNVVPLPLPWLEISIALSLLGALCVSRIQDPLRAWRVGLGFSSAIVLGSLLACVGYYVCRESGIEAGSGFHVHLFGREFLGVDGVNAPLLPMVALLQFLTALATGRTKMRRFSLQWSLAGVGLRLATFGCIAPWGLIALLVIGTVPPYLELRNRKKSTRIYVLHMAVFVAFLVISWAFIDPSAGHHDQPVWATVLLLVAVLIRCGTVPAHCWLTDWFENASFGTALLFVTPLPGIYVVIRLVLPVAPDSVLQVMGVISLITAIYAACMALVQQDTRRLFAYLFISHASLVLVGLELHTSISLTGALALWISAALSLTGFGLTLRALEARFGHGSLSRFQGLYEHSPTLAVCFLLTGLTNVGFPGTFGFVATELLVDGAVRASPYVGLIVALVAAFNGIAVVRAYFRLFTGARHASTVPLTIGARERFAVLTLAALLLGGGIFPQLHIASRQQAADEILERRQNTSVGGAVDPESADGQPATH